MKNAGCITVPCGISDEYRFIVTDNYTVTGCEYVINKYANYRTNVSFRVTA